MAGLGFWIGGQFVAVPQALSESGGGVAYMAHIGGFFAGMALIPFFKYRHVGLFDRNVGLANWANRPLNFQEVKAEAQVRYRRSVPSSVKVQSNDNNKNLPGSSVPVSYRKKTDNVRNDLKTGPWA